MKSEATETTQTRGQESTIDGPVFDSWLRNKVPGEIVQLNEFNSSRIIRPHKWLKTRWMLYEHYYNVPRKSTNVIYKYPTEEISNQIRDH